jgi:3-oxoacyl-(acyl-carrier-protein) synthase
LGRFAQMALAASRQALQDAKIEVGQLSPEERERIVGSP